MYKIARKYVGKILPSDAALTTNPPISFDKLHLDHNDDQILLLPLSPTFGISP